jgi:hypothetical protein
LKRKPTRSPPPPVPCASGYRYTNRRATWFSIDLSYRVLDDLKGIICLSTEPSGAEAARTSSPANKSPMIVVSSPPPWRASHVPSWHGIASQCRRSLRRRSQGPRQTVIPSCMYT